MDGDENWRQEGHEPHSLELRARGRGLFVQDSTWLCFCGHDRTHRYVHLCSRCVCECTFRRGLSVYQIGVAPQSVCLEGLFPQVFAGGYTFATGSSASPRA